MIPVRGHNAVMPAAAVPHEAEYDPPVQQPEAFRSVYRNHCVGAIAQDTSGPGDWAGVAVCWLDQSGQLDPCPFRIRVVTGDGLSEGHFDRRAALQLHAALSAALALDPPEAQAGSEASHAAAETPASGDMRQPDTTIDATALHWVPSDR